MIKLSSLLAFTFFLTATLISAQSVTERVRFDTYLSSVNNDLVNNFSNTSWLTMVTSGGITGGAVQPPDSISWGNDVITYCRNYLNLTDTLMLTSVCFKYNSAMVHPNAFQRAADIWLFGDVINHWMIFSVNYNQHMTIVSYGATSDSLATLTNGHWYQLVASCKALNAPPGDWVYSRAEVFDLGTSGTSIPVSAGRNTLIFQDVDVATSVHFDVKVSGARYGGAEWLDDFSFMGVPGSNSCSLTGIHEVGPGIDAYSFYPQPAGDVMIITDKNQMNHSHTSFELLDATGRLLAQEENIVFPYPVKLDAFADGIYFINLAGEYGTFRKEIIRYSGR